MVASTVTFGAPLSIPTGGVDGRDLLVADVDRDGLADVFVANETLASISLLRGQPSGGFANGTALPAPNLVGAMVVADISGDRLVDLVAASGATASATVATGRGDGDFGTAVPVGVPWSVDWLQAVDWTADGIPDLLAASGDSPEIVLLPGLGSGVFGAAVIATMPFVVAGSAVGDFDGDGRPDLACVGVGSAQILVVRNDGAGGFLPVVSTMTTARGGSLVCCDLDGDRLPDLVSVDADLGTITSFLGQGSASFTEGQTIGMTLGVIDRIAAGDVDGDGFCDVAVTAGSEVIVAYSDGHGGLRGAEVVRTETSPVRSVAIADVRGIGVYDVLYVRGGDQLVVLQNPRTGVSGLEGYGEGTPNCLGRIGLWANGQPALASTDFGYITTNAPASAVGMILLGGPADVDGSDPFGLGARFHLQLVGGLAVNRLVFSDPLGMCFTPDAMPVDAGLAGLTLFVQTLWLTDFATTCSASPAGLASSRGLSVTIQP